MIMKTSARVPSWAAITRGTRNICRRMIAAIALAACVFVAPAIASMSRGPIHAVRVPRIDSRVVEHLQRWADEEKDSCSEEI
jgi:hypothetical protein